MFKEVGKDLGIDAPNEGYYDCILNLNDKEIENKYIYIGEVGDSSYVKFYSYNGTKLDIIKRHGLSLKTQNYTRIIPFYINIEEIYQGNGEYRFRLYYKNLLKPFQVGLRSGKPLVLHFSDVIKKVIVDFFRVIYCLIQVFVFIWLTVSTLRLKECFLIDKILYFLLSFFCILSIVSVSGIPRIFIGFQYVIVSNQIVQILMYGFFSLAYISLFRFKSQIFRIMSFLPFMLSLFSVFFIYRNGTNFSSGLFSFLIAFIPIFNILLSFVSEISFSGCFFSSFRNPFFNYASSLFIIFIYFFDSFNSYFLNSKFDYLSHYIGIFYFLFFLNNSYVFRANQIYRLSNKLELVKLKLLNSLAQQNDDMTIRISQFFKEVSALLNTDYARLSIVGKKNSVAYLYDYGANQMALVPFEQKDKKNPSLDFAFDVPNYNVKFELTRKNSKIFTNDILNLRDELFSFSSMFFGILFAQKTLNEKNQLLSMMRGRVHPHQTLSEEYFLENFEFSTTLKTHALIRGDLVGSTSLNEVYGAKMIEEIIDKYFLELFEKYKDQGIILNRLNGDEVYFIFPALSLDTENSQCVEKCYLFLQDINSHEQSLAVISKERGVFMPLRYRFVMNTADNLKSDVALKSMNQVADGELDAMKRVLDYVAAEGECVVMENAFNLLTNKNELIELSPQRLRGKLKNIRLFSLGKKI